MPTKPTRRRRPTMQPAARTADRQRAAAHGTVLRRPDAACRQAPPMSETGWGVGLGGLPCPGRSTVGPSDAATVELFCPPRLDETDAEQGRPDRYCCCSGHAGVAVYGGGASGSSRPHRKGGHCMAPHGPAGRRTWRSGGAATSRLVCMRAAAPMHAAAQRRCRVGFAAQLQCSGACRTAPCGGRRRTVATRKVCIWQVARHAVAGDPGGVTGVWSVSRTPHGGAFFEGSGCQVARSPHQVLLQAGRLSPQRYRRDGAGLPRRLCCIGRHPLTSPACRAERKKPGSAACLTASGMTGG